MSKPKKPVRLDETPTLADREAWALAKLQPEVALRRLKSRMRARQINLLSPKWGDGGRPFPKWHAGMTTEEYILSYTPSCTQRTVQYVHRRHVPAPWEGMLPDAPVVHGPNHRWVYTPGEQRTPEEAAK